MKRLVWFVFTLVALGGLFLIALGISIQLGKATVRPTPGALTATATYRDTPQAVTPRPTWTATPAPYPTPDRRPFKAFLPEVESQ